MADAPSTPPTPPSTPPQPPIVDPTSRLTHGTPSEQTQLHLRILSELGELVRLGAVVARTTLLSDGSTPRYSLTPPLATALRQRLERDGFDVGTEPLPNGQRGTYATRRTTPSRGWET